MAQQERMPDEQDAWGGEYVGFRFKKPDDPTAQQQAQEESGESSGASTPESGGSSSGWSSGADASGVAGGMPAQKGNRKALSKSRLSFLSRCVLCPAARRLSPVCPLPAGGLKYTPARLQELSVADLFLNVQENYRGKRGLLLDYYPSTGLCRKYF